MKIVRVPIDQVKTWKDNPRTIKKGDYERLKKQILELGFYKPLVATREGRSYIRLLNGKKADLIFTDPPYNVAYQGTKFAPVLNDDLSEEGFITFVEAWMECLKRNTKQGGVFYICSGYSSYPAFVYTIKKTGMTFAGPIVWVKNNTSLGWNDYRHKHEMVLKGTTTKAKKAVPILYGWNGGRHYFFESRFEADVWEMNRRASTTMLHPTQKPLGLIQRAIKNSSRPGDLVLDPFAGSGSTLVAAEREGRTARLMELDPVYVDVIIRRFAALGGPDEDEIRATREPGPGGKPGKAPVRPRLRAEARGPVRKPGKAKVKPQAEAQSQGQGAQE